MQKTIMIIGAAQEHCIGIDTAHSMGYKVFVTDGNPSSPGFALADAYAVASTYDFEATLAAARKYISSGGKIDGVMTLASDVPYTVAFVAQHLKLTGIGLEPAENASEKVRMKDLFAQHKIPMPFYKGVKSAEEIIHALPKTGLPIVVKPVDSRGARGVQLIRDSAQISSSFQIAMQYSASKRVMFEQYLPGPQLSTEGFMVHGHAYIPAIFDRNYEFLDKYAPYIVEDGGEMPSIYSKQYKDEVHSVMEKSAIALGIETGVIKGDLVIHEGKVKVIEIAARLSGGFFGTVATPVSCGVDLVKANILLSLGEPLTSEMLQHSTGRAAAIRFAFPSPGRIVKISGIEKISNDPACKYAHVFAKPGDIIEPITNHPGRPAVVVCDGKNLQEAVSNAKRLIGYLEWELTYA